ncbi:MAG: hypothetical protein HYZ68_00320 [Chloroflexi bacterium]|nr:hypothetical protein [Chloroflexota bacterium]
MQAHSQPHLPGPSPWPPLLGLGVGLLGAGVALDAGVVLALGALISLAGLLGWMYDEIRGSREHE